MIDDNNTFGVSVIADGVFKMFQLDYILKYRLVPRYVWTASFKLLDGSMSLLLHLKLSEQRLVTAKIQYTNASARGDCACEQLGILSWCDSRSLLISNCVEDLIIMLLRILRNASSPHQVKRNLTFQGIWMPLHHHKYEWTSFSVILDFNSRHIKREDNMVFQVSDNRLWWWCFETC